MTRYRTYFAMTQARSLACTRSIRENDEDAMSAGSLLLKGTSFARIEVWEGAAVWGLRSNGGGITQVRCAGMI
jgi:hypothetical protein